MIKKKLEEYLDYKQPQPYIVSNEQYSNEYKTPVLTAGKSFLLGMTNDTKGIYPASKDEPIILFDDFTTDIKWVDFPFKVKSSACKILVPRNDTNLRFCYYGMKSLNFDASQHKRYWISQYSQMQLPDYPNARKAEIVERLSRIENQINIKENQLNKLDSLVKSRFIEMFGDILINERKWPIKRLGDVCRVINGRAYSAPELLDSGKYKVLRVGNFFTNDSWYFSNLELPADKYCEKGDLLFAWSASFGPRIWDGDKVIYHYHIWKLQDYENALDKIFFSEELNWIVEDLKKKQHGSTMSHFTKGDMENEQLPVPPIELQTQFRSFYELIDKSRFDQSQEKARISPMSDRI